MLDPTDLASGPVAWQDIAAGLRVVVTPKGPVVELADGKDATGALRWIKAIVLPDRTGTDTPIYEGWKEIAAAIGCERSKAHRYAHQRVNPLPVIKGSLGRVWIFRPVLRAWVTSRSYSILANDHGEDSEETVGDQRGAKKGRLPPETKSNTDASVSSTPDRRKVKPRNIAQHRSVKRR